MLCNPASAARVCARLIERASRSIPTTSHECARFDNTSTNSPFTDITEQPAPLQVVRYRLDSTPPVARGTAPVLARLFLAKSLYLSLSSSAHAIIGIQELSPEEIDVVAFSW